MKESFTFDDVCLEPVFNNVKSRTEPDLSTMLTKTISMKIPILAANMDTVINKELADVLVKNGSVPIFHRWLIAAEKKELFNTYKHAFFSIGLNTGFDFIDEINISNIVIDVAHGHSEAVLNLITELKSKNSHLNIIAGNVCTEDGYTDLVNAGADAVKVGIGPGAACTTRVVTGFGVPQFSAIQDCYEAAKRLKAPIIADGGIRCSRDVVLALAAGASSVMIGKLFAQCKESASHGLYRGMASDTFRKEGTVAEGIQMGVDCNLKAQDLIDRLVGGVRSGLTYGGSRTLSELRRKAIFRKVTQSYMLESNVRI
jgi:IMP dehydrogenase